MKKKTENDRDNMGIYKTKDNIIKEIVKPTLDVIASMESELLTELDTKRKGTRYLNLSTEYDITKKIC